MESKMKNKTYQCARCKQWFDGALFKDPFNNGERAVWYKDKPFCPRCSSLFNTCGTCKGQNYCAFQEDPAPIPHMIMTQIHEGNMIIMGETFNPKRIRALCIEGKCKCLIKIEGKYACGRKFLVCPNYDEIEF